MVIPSWSHLSWSSWFVLPFWFAFGCYAIGADLTPAQQEQLKRLSGENAAKIVQLIPRIPDWIEMAKALRSAATSPAALEQAKLRAVSLALAEAEKQAPELFEAAATAEAEVRQTAAKLNAAVAEIRATLDRIRGELENLPAQEQLQQQALDRLKSEVERQLDQQLVAIRADLEKKLPGWYDRLQTARQLAAGNTSGLINQARAKAVAELTIIVKQAVARPEEWFPNWPEVQKAIAAFEQAKVAGKDLLTSARDVAQ